MDNPIKMDENWGYPYLGNPHMHHMNLITTTRGRWSILGGLSNWGKLRMYHLNVDLFKWEIDGEGRPSPTWSPIICHGPNLLQPTRNNRQMNSGCDNPPIWKSLKSGQDHLSKWSIPSQTNPTYYIDIFFRNWGQYFPWNTNGPTLILKGAGAQRIWLHIYLLVGGWPTIVVNILFIYGYYMVNDG